MVAFGWDVCACLGSSAMKTPLVKSLEERRTLVPILLQSVQFSSTLWGDVICCVSWQFASKLLYLLAGQEYLEGILLHILQVLMLHYEHPFVHIIPAGGNMNSFCHFCKIHHVWEKIYINFSKFLGGLWIMHVGGKQLELGLRLFFSTLFNLSHEF